MFGDVAHDRQEVIPVQALAGDLAMQRRDRCGRLGLGDRRGYAGFGAELGEGVLGQPQLVTADDGRIVHQIEAGEDAPAVDAYLHLGQRLEAFGAAGGAVAVQIGDILAVGVDGDPAQRQVHRGFAVERRVAGNAGHAGGFAGEVMAI